MALTPLGVVGDLLLVAGFGLGIAGLALVSTALALCVAGIVLFGAGIIITALDARKPPGIPKPHGPFERDTAT